MNTMPWTPAAILAGVIILAVIALLVRKKRPIDYYTWFIIGCSWIVLGIALGGYAFSVIGLVFVIVGLIHRKEWKKSKADWSEKNITKWIILALVAFVLAALVAGLISFLVNK